MEVIEQLRLMNPHWEQGFVYGYPLKRKIFTNLNQALNHPLVVMITGPRRVGKTVLMKQMIDDLVAAGHPRTNILFFSFDEYRQSPIKVIKTWEQLIGRKVRGQTYFVFLDEVQNIEHWVEQIKVLYDHLGVKLVVSGSMSLSLKKGVGGLAGRVQEFYIPPLFYEEYLQFLGKPRSEIVVEDWQQFRTYLFRQLPDLVFNPSINPEEYVKTIVRKVIYEDISQLYNPEFCGEVEAIFRIICKDPGQIINISDVAKDFGISRPTVAHYFNMLEESFLVRKLYNYSRNPRKVETRLKKYYPHYTTLTLFSRFAPFGKIAETEVAWKLNAQFFWNYRGQEIDFVVDNIGVEVKSGNVITQKDVKWLIKNKIKLGKKWLVVQPLARLNIDPSKHGLRVLYLNEIDKLANYA